MELSIRTLFVKIIEYTSINIGNLETDTENSYKDGPLHNMCVNILACIKNNHIIPAIIEGIAPSLADSYSTNRNYVIKFLKPYYVICVVCL